MTSTTTVAWQDEFTVLESLETAEFDGDLLMELLEEAPPEIADEHRVEYVIRSFQAEIDSAGPSKANMSLETVDIEDFPRFLDGCDGWTYPDDDGRWFDWEEMDTRECYMYEVGDAGEFTSYCHHHAETAEQVYEPLW